MRARLSQLLDCGPLQLEFAPNDLGKPILVAPYSTRPLAFNISHARGCIGVVIGAGQDCGIDIEAVSSVADSADIRRQILTRDEQRQIQNTPEDQRNDLLTRLWTLKEAFLKARGDGLSTPPNTISVSIASDGAYLDRKIPDAHKWRLENFLWREKFQVSLCFSSGYEIDHIDNAVVFLRKFAPLIVAE